MLFNGYMSAIDLTDVETQWLIHLERQPQLAGAVVPGPIMDRLRELALVTNDGFVTAQGSALVARRTARIA